MIGAGTMGGGISMNFLSAGIPGDDRRNGAGSARPRHRRDAQELRGDRRQGQDDRRAGRSRRWARSSPTLDFEALADCDLIIEAVFEQMEIKKEIFGRLDKIAKPGAILASNTSYLNVDEIAASTSRPQDVVGLHFFSPANIMKLLEVVRGAKTAPDVLVTAMALAKKIKKVAVVAGVCHGFIGNRMLMPRQVEATKLLLEGATPEQIDRVHVEFGMPMGPFQMADLAGVDIGWHRDPTRIENIRDALAAEGRWGQKKQAGFYDYDDKRRPSPSPARAGDHRRLPRQGRASRSATSPTRKSSSARSTRWSTRARKSSRKAWPSAPPTSMWCGSTAMAGRSIAAARCTGPTPKGCRRSSTA